MLEYKLVYFNARGRAEAIRYIFAYANQKYTDFRISQHDWPDYKPLTVFGQVPMLEISDDKSVVKIAQTLAICRHLGNHFNLNGKTELERARADMIADQTFDILNLYNVVRFEMDAQLRADRMERFWTQTLPYYIGLFESLFETQKTMFVAGDSVTWADFVFAAFFDLIGEKQRQPLFEKYECCRVICNHIENFKEIAKWKKNRPQTEL
jgi:glutathione S-transferase